MDYESLSSQLVRVLRGRRSQLGFSRRLGYRSNVAYLWESGRRSPPASVLLRGAARTGISLGDVLRRFHRSAMPSWLEQADAEALTTWVRMLDELRGSTSIGTVAARVGCSRFAAARWLRGTSEPRLPDFLRLVEACSQRLLDLVAELADPTQLGSTAVAWRRLEAARSLFYEAPDAQLVLLGLELEGYRRRAAHDEVWLGAELGLSVAQVHQGVERLAQSGQIRRVGAHYAPHAVQAVDTRRHPDAGKVLRAWAARRGLAAIEAGSDGQFSFNVFSVSEADYLELKALQVQHWARMRAIIARSEPSERVVLCNLQLVPSGSQTRDPATAST